VRHHSPVHAPPAPAPIARADLGDGPPVLLVHGWSSFKEAWFTVPERLAAAGFRAVAVDLPGSGASAAARRGRGAAGVRHGALGYADALEPLARELGPLALAGHSLGAQTALVLAVRRPELVERVVLVAPYALPGARLRLPPRTFLDAVVLPVVGRPIGHAGMRWLQRSLRRTRASYASAVARPDALRGDPAVRALLEDAAGRLRRADRHVMVESLRAGVLADLRPLAARVRQPTLVVGGDRDRVAPPAKVDALAAALPDGRRVRLPGVGHLPQVEAPAALVDHVVRHLRAGAPAPAAA
jgi:pimeloyl-ACP methyl ester carboxylesterase